MILKQFDYSEFTGQANEWSLNNFSLNDKVNLLVGKNAMGKTRTMYRISALADILIGQQSVSLETIDSAKFSVVFFENSTKYQYVLETKDRLILTEKLIVDGITMLERLEDGKGTMYYTEQKRNIAFHIQDNRLALLSRRDSIQHPYLEDIFKWSEGLRLYYFGSSREMGQRNILAGVDVEYFVSGELNIRDTIRVNEIYLKGLKEFGENFSNSIITDMNDIGYDIENLSVAKNPYTAIVIEDRSPLYMLCVKEHDRSANLYQSGMSQGMFRALSLLIQITYNAAKNLSMVILIDDIGEGLDFDRSTKLIKLLIDLAEKNDNIQLIMSTNDRFVMNAVPLEYWQVIQRNAGKCQVFNYQNSKEKFDEFEYTGLNNFDFLRTDFINSK